MNRQEQAWRMKNLARRSGYPVVAVLALGLAAGLWASTARAQEDDGASKKSAARARYSHAEHKGRGVDQSKCSKCHTLDENYRTSPPLSGKDHQPCATAGCHFDEFFETEPTICTVCHESSDPRVEQKAILRARPRSEFTGNTMSHKSHVALVGKKGNAACMRCHGNKFGGENRPKTGGHSACSGCHAKMAEPKMDDCGSCHAMGGKGGSALPKPSQWNVRAKFKHESHGRDPRKNRETSCESCHRTIAKATDLADIQSPKMEFCDSCHDGDKAFKTTGFTCHLCHGEAANE